MLEGLRLNALRSKDKKAEILRTGWSWTLESVWAGGGSLHSGQMGGLVQQHGNGERTQQSLQAEKSEKDK